MEVFFTPPNVVYDREYARRTYHEVHGSRLPFLSAEDLVLRKLVNTRLRRGIDYDDAVGILAIQGPTMDLHYLRQHCGPYRICELLERAMKEAEAARAS